MEEERPGKPLSEEPEPEPQTEADVAKPDAGGPGVCKFFLRGRCHFGERCRLSHSLPECKPEPEPEPEEEKGSKNRKTRKKSGRAEKAKDEPQEPEKKPRMRTAGDVISRILWDSSVDPADFVVGHLDRFLGVLERPFADFSWDAQVCDSDYSEELTIPQHRIMYFSYKGQHVWDRDSRTDRVFGSTGQTVLPPFDREDQTQENAPPDTQQEGERSQAEKNELGDSVGNLGDPEDKVGRAVNGLTDEQPADASLARQAEGLSVEHLAPEEDWKDICEEVVPSVPSVPTAPQEPQPGRPSRKPTHFICFRVDSPAALLAFQRVQRKVLTHLPQSEEFWVNPATLHVTLSLLVLQGPAEVQTAAELLRSVVRSIYKPPITVFLPPKLKHFNGRVLFIPPRPIPDIQSLNTPLQEAFRQKGWLHRHSKCPNYHVTLAKAEAKEEGEAAERMFEDVGVIRLAKDINFGKLEVDKLYLCVNGVPKTESGFYQTVCAVQLPTV
ncbi:leukocyte receptor cluster member 9 [Salminus brasiliensis]|uniref:leukocyte receptor cluster member 9 n=1 Tax=Salminus brasiliensis TaxID=930266 RepID=UPI003B832346